MNLMHPAKDITMITMMQTSGQKPKCAYFKAYQTRKYQMNRTEFGRYTFVIKNIFDEEHNYILQWHRINMEHDESMEESMLPDKQEPKGFQSSGFPNPTNTPRPSRSHYHAVEYCIYQ